jgi:hypothetical protein
MRIGHVDAAPATATSFSIVRRFSEGLEVIGMKGRSADPAVRRRENRINDPGDVDSTADEIRPAGEERSKIISSLITRR